MQSFPYRIVVEWSDEDGAYIARVPSLRYCAAHGATPEKAVREVKVAAEGILADMQEEGKPLPTPDTTESYSGQTRLRMPRSLHRQLAQIAAAEDVSLNQLMVALLSQRGPRQKAA